MPSSPVTSSPVHTPFTHVLQDRKHVEDVCLQATRVELTLGTSDPPVPCVVSITDSEGNAQDMTTDFRHIHKDWHIIFNVELSPGQRQKEVAQRIKESLNTRSIRIIDRYHGNGPYSSQDADANFQCLVKDLASLWADSLSGQNSAASLSPRTTLSISGVRTLRRDDSSSTSSLVSALSTPPLTPMSTLASPWGTYPRASHQSFSTSASSFSVDDDDAEADPVYLNLVSGGSTAPGTPLQKHGSESIFQRPPTRTVITYEDDGDHLLAKLAAIELEQLRQEEKQLGLKLVTEIDLTDTPSTTSREYTDDEASHFQGTEHPTELTLPSPGGLTAPPRRSLEEPPSPVTPATPEAVVEKLVSLPVEAPVPADADEQAPATTRSWWTLFSQARVSTSVKAGTLVTSSDVPAIIFPTPPTDTEKYLYAQTRRVPLYVFGTLSFLSVSVGMWFFAVSSQDFFWFGAFVAMIQAYLIVSYTVGYAGRDYNLEAHKQILADHPLAVEPAVDIYLPCCKEPLEILENTYKYVSQLEYTNYKVYVLDDGGLDSVERLAEQYKFNYISRDNKPYLKKAGNLRYAFTRTKGEFFVIFDADFCPRPDFLAETLPIMRNDEKIAIVQSPQFFRPSAEQTWVEQGASATQELFYRIVQVNRDRWGASICVGSNAVYRRSSLVEVGGTAEIGHSEDVHTGFYALTRGWKLRYIPLALACGVSPDTPKAFFSQQMRWCSGSTTLLTNPEFWRSQLNIIQKVCFMSGMLYYSASALMIFLTPLPGLLMLWIKPDLVLFYNFAYAFPSLIYSVVVFRLWSRQRYNFNVNFVFVIQQYAYLMAVKDRLLGTTASWVPSGDTKSHDGKKKVPGGNNKYRNMRILCSGWVIGTTVAVIVGSVLRILDGHKWYNFLPLLILDAYNLFIAHKFILFS